MELYRSVYSTITKLDNIISLKISADRVHMDLIFPQTVDPSFWKNIRI